MSEEIKYTTIIKCPACGFEREEKMSPNHCLIVYECKKCGKWLRPKEGEGCCCVYCSYGSVKCPLKQKEDLCC